MKKAVLDSRLSLSLAQVTLMVDSDPRKTGNTALLVFSVVYVYLCREGSSSQSATETMI